MPAIHYDSHKVNSQSTHYTAEEETTAIGDKRQQSAAARRLEDSKPDELNINTTWKFV